MFGQNPKDWETLDVDRLDETSWVATGPTKSRLLARSTTMLIARRRSRGFTKMVFRASLQTLTTNTAAKVSTIPQIQGYVRSILSDNTVRMTYLDIDAVLKKPSRKARNRKAPSRANQFAEK